mmetsp:Transcript_60380/g.67555  ORF Transcript_60380/g.67555 Transcript_60380/m.67555 type:complete len:80 (-) Transcript_60380:1508-1747(-)
MFQFSYLPSRKRRGESSFFVHCLILIDACIRILIVILFIYLIFQFPRCLFGTAQGQRYLSTSVRVVYRIVSIPEDASFL